MSASNASSSSNANNEESQVPILPDSTVLQIGQHWEQGAKALRYLFVFGDSYSSVGYDIDGPIPCDDEPLGIPYPGNTFTEGTYEDPLPNWIGYLVGDYNPSSRPLLVFDYAFGGHDINRCAWQVKMEFLPHAAKKPNWAPWTADGSLFVIWIGTNDVRMYKPEDQVKSPGRIIGFQEQMYEAGARNFLLIDVGPHRRHLDEPRSEGLKALDEKCAQWNTRLYAEFKTFLESHPDATGLYFSSWNLCLKIYSNPTEYGFNRADITRSGGGMWCDHIHPTTRLHEIFAKEVKAFLEGATGEPERHVEAKSE